jgi:hypothetical protein
MAIEQEGIRVPPKHLTDSVKGDIINIYRTLFPEEVPGGFALFLLTNKGPFVLTDAPTPQAAVEVLRQVIDQLESGERTIIQDHRRNTDPTD